MAVAQQPRPLGIQVLPLEDVRPGNNYRKTFDPEKLAELAKSIAAQGVLQPIKVRPVPDPEGTDPRPQYEVVFGERRYRAAKDAGLTEIPAIVEDLTDEQVIEQQLEENNARDDVHPLEECIAFERLRDEFGRSADEIAEKIGKSKSYVYGRLKFQDLGEAGRKAYLAGEIDASKALLLARMPAALQPKALEDILEPGWGGPMSVREAADHIRRAYMLKIADAPFDTKDPTLDAVAGACGPCPKRTGSAPDLFGDVGEEDLCTDPDCFKAKTEAAWRQKSEALAVLKGVKVLSVQASAKLFGFDGSLYSSSPYVKLSDKCPTDPDRRTFQKLIGSSPKGMVVARGPKGQAVKLFPKKKLAEAMEAAGVEDVQPPAASPTAYNGVPDRAAQERNRKFELERQARARASDACAQRAVELAEQKGLPVQTRNQILFELMQHTDWEPAVRRRWLTLDEATYVLDPADEKAIRIELAKLNDDQRWALLLEMCLPVPFNHAGKANKNFLEILEGLGGSEADVKAALKEAKKEVRAEMAPAAKPKRKKVGQGAAVKKKASKKSSGTKKESADEEAEPRTCKRPDCENAVPGRKRLCAVHEGTRP